MEVHIASSGIYVYSYSTCMNKTISTQKKYLMAKNCYWNLCYNLMKRNFFSQQFRLLRCVLLNSTCEPSVPKPPVLLRFFKWTDIVHEDAPRREKQTLRVLAYFPSSLLFTPWHSCFWNLSTYSLKYYDTTQVFKEKNKAYIQEL